MTAMPDPRSLCVLVAEIVGGDRVTSRLGETETARAVERCLNRVDLAIGGSDGEIISRDHTSVIAIFEQCDNGVLAACEAVDRVHKLPPVSGTQMRLRIGVHYGIKDDGVEGEAVDGARQILLICADGQALASASAVAELSPSVRHFASAEPFRPPPGNRLLWPVFAIGNQSGVVVAQVAAHPAPAPAPAASATPRHIPAAPPAASTTPVPRPPSAPPPPPHARRLRLRHQQDTLLLEENRPIVLIGRELGNDIVIIDPRASRQHARIERRRDGFVLIDQSTNGCFVIDGDHPERSIKGEELGLSSNTGRIGFGFSPLETEDDTVFFELV
jgi:hypothetical protein